MNPERDHSFSRNIRAETLFRDPHSYGGFLKSRWLKMRGFYEEECFGEACIKFLLYAMLPKRQRRGVLSSSQVQGWEASMWLDKMYVS